MKKLLFLLGLFVLTPYGMSEERFVYLKQVESTPPVISGMWPFRVFNNEWSTTEDIKEYFDAQKKIINALSADSAPLHEEQNSIVKFAALGDVFHVDQPSDYLQPKLKQYLMDFDVVAGNLETSISPSFPIEDRLFDVNSSDDVLSLTRVGENKNLYTVLSTANNHTFDFPDPARNETLKALGENHVLQNGIVDGRGTPFTLFKRKDITFAFYAITTFVNKPHVLEESKVTINPILKNSSFLPWQKEAPLDFLELETILSDMKEAADVVVLSIHWGREHESYPRSEQIVLAHKLVEAGVDVLMGHHAHAIQPSEVCFVDGYEHAKITQAIDSGNICQLNSGKNQKRKAIIYYSLGNFVGFTPFFWHQLGLINSVVFSKNKINEVDWYRPNSKITYDSIDRPPYGEHSVDFLSSYVQSNCYKESCPKGIQYMVKVADRHIHHQSLSRLEEVRTILVSFYRSIIDGLYHIPRLLKKEISQ